MMKLCFPKPLFFAAVKVEKENLKPFFDFVGEKYQNLSVSIPTIGEDYILCPESFDSLDGDHLKMFEVEFGDYVFSPNGIDIVSAPAALFELMNDFVQDLEPKQFENLKNGLDLNSTLVDVTEKALKLALEGSENDNI